MTYFDTVALANMSRMSVGCVRSRKPERRVLKQNVGDDTGTWSRRRCNSTVCSWLTAAAFAAACLLKACVSGESVITTVAGGGIGDGGAATAAWLRHPSSVSTVTNASNGGVVLYIADRGNHRIRRVDEGGIITTVAGTGSGTFGGDGGLATAAQLFYPQGVSAWYNASSGGVVLYIADYGNNRIRRVDEDGIITTVAGIGSAAFGGDGGQAAAEHLKNPYGVSAVHNPRNGDVVLYIADRGSHR
ncbi:hypothetical protein EON66_06710, partial [archaeon]